MTLNQMAELIQRMIENNDHGATRRYDKREIVLHIKAALAELMQAKMEKEKAIGYSDIDGNMIVTYKNQTVTKDTDLDLYYTILPSTPLSLPDNQGVYQVSLMKGQGEVFIPMTNGMVGLLHGLDASCLEGQIGYYIENGKIMYHQGYKIAGKSVLVKMVLTDETAECSEGFQGPIIDIVMRRLLMVNQPEDVLNDHNQRREA